MTTTVNIGLNVSGGTNLTSVEVQAALINVGAATVVDAQIFQSNTEETLVFELGAALTPEQAFAVSAALGQDCIAQYSNGVGGLYGPNAAAWGDFNPEFFLLIDGRTLAAATVPTYTFHIDPGHGWLEVPILELSRLGILAEVSHYSYLKDGNAYLEEDCDFSLFAHAKAAAAEDFNVVDKHTNYDSPIRRYARFI